MKPFTTNAHWLGDEVDEDEADAPPPAALIDGSAAGETAESAPPLNYFRAVEGRVVVSVDRIEEILDQYRVRGLRGHLIDAPSMADGNVEDSLTWTAPIGEREAIRGWLLGTGNAVILPSSATPGSLLAELVGAGVDEPIPW